MMNTELREKTMIAGLLTAGIIAAIFLVTAILHGARGEEIAPVVPAQWKIIVTVQTSEVGAVKLVYGTKTSGPNFYVSQAACEIAMQTDDIFRAALLNVAKMAAQNGDTITSIDCVFDVLKPPGEKVD